MSVSSLRQTPPLPDWVAVLLAGVVLMMGQLQLRLAQGAVLADIAVFGLIAWWIVVSVSDSGRRLGRQLLLPFVAILAGSLIALTPHGLSSWGVRDLVLDVAAGLTLLAALGVAGASSTRQWRWYRLALGSSLLLVMLQLLVSRGDELRASAGFPNPNLAGHFVVTVTALVVAMASSRWHRLAFLSVGAVAWSLTGSFGALLQAAAMIGYWSLHRSRRRLAAGVAVGVVGVAAFAVLVIQRFPSLTVAGLSTGRLDRSGDGRFEKWVDGAEVFLARPVGVGPGAVNALELSDNELHNEPLAYLVERGPLALLGLGLVGLVLWLNARPGGTGRALLVGFAVASMFRETSHYRHLWICVALVLAWEGTRDRLDRNPIPGDGALVGGAR